MAPTALQTRRRARAAETVSVRRQRAARAAPPGRVQEGGKKSSRGASRRENVSERMQPFGVEACRIAIVRQATSNVHPTRWRAVLAPKPAAKKARAVKKRRDLAWRWAFDAERLRKTPLEMPRKAPGGHGPVGAEALRWPFNRVQFARKTLFLGS